MRPRQTPSLLDYQLFTFLAWTLLAWACLVLLLYLHPSAPPPVALALCIFGVLGNTFCVCIRLHHLGWMRGFHTCISILEQSHGQTPPADPTVPPSEDRS